MSARQQGVPTVSVVVPSYNRASCLEATVNSILGQTVPPTEIIIVDDGSIDDTAAVCSRFPEPVRYVYRPNGGTAAAKNTGMREARGELIAFLDADDLWDPIKLETQIALHAAHPEIGWSLTNHLTTDGESRLLPGPQGFVRDFPAFTETGLDPDAFFARFMQRSELLAGNRSHIVYTGDVFELLFDGNVAFPSCVMLHRRMMSQAGLFDETFRYASDTEYFHRLAAMGQLGIVMTPLFFWRRGQANTNVSSGNMTEIVQNALKSLDRAAALRGDLSPAAEVRYRDGRRRLLVRLAYIQLSNLDRLAARRTLRQAWAAGARISPKALGIYGASLLPGAALRGLHRLKQRIGG